MRDDLPGTNGDIPGELLARVAETAVSDALKSLPATALLPTSEFIVTKATDEPKIGKVIDVDGGVVLVGLGVADGLKVGDRLEIQTSTGTKLPVILSRVRPRTCDATFATTTPPAHRQWVQIGDTVTVIVTPSVAGGKP